MVQTIERVRENESQKEEERGESRESGWMEKKRRVIVKRLFSMSSISFSFG